jgi:hypothetical protein
VGFIISRRPLRALRDASADIRNPSLNVRYAQLRTYDRPWEIADIAKLVEDAEAAPTRSEPFEKQVRWRSLATVTEC